MIKSDTIIEMIDRWGKKICQQLKDKYCFCFVILIRKKGDPVEETKYTAMCTDVNVHDIAALSLVAESLLKPRK